MMGSRIIKSFYFNQSLRYLHRDPPIIIVFLTVRTTSEEGTAQFAETAVYVNKRYLECRCDKFCTCPEPDAVSEPMMSANRKNVNVFALPTISPSCTHTDSNCPN